MVVVDVDDVGVVDGGGDVVNVVDFVVLLFSMLLKFCF